VTLLLSPAGVFQAGRSSIHWSRKHSRHRLIRWVFCCGSWCQQQQPQFALQLQNRAQRQASHQQRPFKDYHTNSQRPAWAPALPCLVCCEAQRQAWQVGTQQRAFTQPFSVDTTPLVSCLQARICHHLSRP